MQAILVNCIAPMTQEMYVSCGSSNLVSQQSYYTLTTEFLAPEDDGDSCHCITLGRHRPGIAAHDGRAIEVRLTFIVDAILVDLVYSYVGQCRDAFLENAKDKGAVLVAAMVDGVKQTTHVHTRGISIIVLLNITILVDIQLRVPYFLNLRRYVIISLDSVYSPEYLKAMSYQSLIVNLFRYKKLLLIITCMKKPHL